MVYTARKFKCTTAARVIYPLKYPFINMIFKKLSQPKTKNDLEKRVGFPVFLGTFKNLEGGGAISLPIVKPSLR